MKEVFISYTTRDAAVAMKLLDFLEGNGYDCFIAPRDVDPGKPYAAELVRAIKECKAVLLVVSSATNESSHVLSEVNIIFNERKPMIPVIIEDFELAPEYLYYLNSFHNITAYPEAIEVYYAGVLNAVESKVPRKVAPAPVPVAPAHTEEVAQKTKTVFDYIPDRGIMINPEDHQRNVSFRTDTFINMMGGIFEKVAELTDEEQAAEIFFRSGYVSGKNFAERINNQWGTGSTFPEIQRKLAKWCEFDSAVGWGHFSVNVDYSDEQGLTGTLTVSEPFVVDKAKKRKVCSFIRGYCDGVLETLLDNVHIDLTCRECPLQSKFKYTCVFDIKEKFD
ncbi:MAG: toll/interleukin-1 receptor domain-containing protein [Clostridia bacterium]|nr:toll/interleukin-1 receptor domain-containing protein [Clostridia bacterium]